MISEPPIIPHWIDGAADSGAAARTAPVFDPALGTANEQVALVGADELQRALAAASRAFVTWRRTSLAKRQAIILRFRELLQARKGELAEIITVAEVHGDHQHVQDGAPVGAPRVGAALGRQAARAPYRHPARVRVLDQPFSGKKPPPLTMDASTLS
jgi:hypothetical protein